MTISNCWYVFIQYFYHFLVNKCSTRWDCPNKSLEKMTLFRFFLWSGVICSITSFMIWKWLWADDDENGQTMPTMVMEPYLFDKNCRNGACNWMQEGGEKLCKFCVYCSGHFVIFGCRLRQCFDYIGKIPVRFQIRSWIGSIIIIFGFLWEFIIKSVWELMEHVLQPISTLECGGIFDSIDPSAGHPFRVDNRLCSLYDRSYLIINFMITNTFPLRNQIKCIHCVCIAPSRNTFNSVFQRKSQFHFSKLSKFQMILLLKFFFMLQYKMSVINTRKISVQ